MGSTSSEVQPFVCLFIDRKELIVKFAVFYLPVGFYQAEGERLYGLDYLLGVFP